MIKANCSRYLDPESVEAHAVDGGDVAVRVYTNGLWEVAPDPRNERLQEDVMESYNAGNFIGFKRVNVRSDDLPKPAPQEGEG